MRRYVKLIELADRVVRAEVSRSGSGWRLEFAIASGREMTDAQEDDFVDWIANELISAGSMKKWASA